MSANYSFVLYSFKPVTWVHFHHITLVLPRRSPLYSHESGNATVLERPGLLRRSKDSISLYPQSLWLKALPALPCLSLTTQPGGMGRTVVGNPYRAIVHDTVVLLNCKVEVWATHIVVAKRTTLKHYHIVKINFFPFTGLAQKLVSVKRI